ncbi:hypothetical protein QBC40DRAFT_278681 [Triangularia verruculosa]|uniref:Uncharacterized protein n=1 Tax=Triangularia verruculosa TaxID=2587418 RepID=A0AAN6XI51_9PEZI|nr:hypothetical protein QBC40DRAFT_278681 [Triangularia verruculosa]
MAPIRVAIIGLSASAKTAWASRAHLPYLFSPLGRSKFEVVALLNSSTEAARAAIKAYNLPPSTKAYGTPEDLAADPEVELVITNTRVDKHVETALPSVEAGKDVYVEWPLAANSDDARKLAEAAKQHGGLGVVGLQGPLGPLPRKLREVIDSGKIGRVLSSEFRANGGIDARDTVPASLSYFTERKVGGYVYTIGFAHQFDLVQSVLGDYKTGLDAPHGFLQIQRPQFKLIGQNKEVVGTVASDVPDLIFVHGYVESGASLHFRFRVGPPFPSEPALVWTIAGTKGEIRVLGPSSTMIHIGNALDPQKFEIHDFETNAVQEVEWDFDDWQKELNFQARNIGAIYEDYYEVKRNGAKGTFLSFDDALKRHEQLEGILSNGLKE